ncbi:Uncharacterised protein [Vibrio cholerae]|nr:Uncharacterised protein [Vibrio cholerae]CSH90387.1 Uncharacterised protein [Vibrio cholerae]CSI66595.1 Uncharacterised protein [Vibrio cholerae]
MRTRQRQFLIHLRTNFTHPAFELAVQRIARLELGGLQLASFTLMINHHQSFCYIKYVIRALIVGRCFTERFKVSH